MVAMTISWFRLQSGQPFVTGSPELAGDVVDNSRRKVQNVVADSSAKRRILEITCLNFSLDGVSLCPTMRKPFDMLAEGLVWKNSRGDWI